MLFFSSLSKDFNRLEILQARIASWDGFWNEDAISLTKELQDFIAESLKKDQTIFEYAVLLEGYLLLKSGTDALAHCSIRLGPLIRLARLNKPLSIAARWLLGRIYCSQASITNDLWHKYSLLNDSLKMFSGCYKVEKVKQPLLLPGTKSEFSEKDLNYSYGEREPCVFNIVYPNRYLSAIALGCADASFTIFNKEQQVDDFYNKGKNFLNEANIYCNQFSAKNYHGYLNNELLSCIIRAMQVVYCNRSSNEKSSVLSSIIKVKEKINQSSIDVIPIEKKREWNASVYATIAFLSSKGSDYEFSRNKMFENIKLVAQYKIGRIDFFTIDPIYRLANNTQEELDEFNLIVKRFNDGKITAEKINMKENTKHVECEMNFHGPVTGVVNKNEGVVNIALQSQYIVEFLEAVEPILKDFEDKNPIATELDQIAYVNALITPSFKQRAIAALKLGGESAVDEFFIENKYLKVGKAILKGWLQGD